MMQQYAFSGPTSSQNGEGLAAVHAQGHPIEDHLVSKCLMQIFDFDDRRSVVFFVILLLHRDVKSCGHFAFR
jgi:hypothetical protein